MGNLFKVVCVSNDYAYVNGKKFMMYKNDIFLAEKTGESILYKIYDLNKNYLHVFSKNTFISMAESRDRQINEIFED